MAIYDDFKADFEKILVFIVNSDRFSFAMTVLSYPVNFLCLIDEIIRDVLVGAHKFLM